MCKFSVRGELVSFMNFHKQRILTSDRRLYSDSWVVCSTAGPELLSNHSWPWTALQPQLSPTRFWPEPTARGAAPSLQQHCGYDCCLWFVEWLFVRLEPRLVFSVTLRGVNRFLSRVPPPAEAAVPSRDCHGAHSAHCLPRRLAIGVCGPSLLFHISGNFAFALWSACLCLETMHRTTKATLTQSPAGVYLLNSCKMTRGGFSLKRLCR